MAKIAIMDESKRESTLLADMAAERIRDLIASGQLRPGDRLNEAEIAESLNISRGPVREAVRRFASEGLVVSLPNAGSRLVQINGDRARSIYEVREVLESLAARLAARRMTASQKAMLAAMLDEHAAMMDREGGDAYPAGISDWDFHLAVLEGSGNETALRICGNELRDILSLCRATHGRIPGRGRAALAEHRRVAEAIIAGDDDFAAVLMGQHIRNSYRNLKLQIDANDPEAKYGD